MEIGKEYIFDGYTGIYKGIDSEVGGVNFKMTCEHPFALFEEKGEIVTGFLSTEKEFEKEYNPVLL